MNLTFFSQKGGVGKSTACILMSDYLSGQGKKVLLVDIDPQATLSETFTLEDVDKSFYDVLMGDCLLEDVVIPISENIHLIPANENLNKLGNEKESKLYKIVKQLKRLSENYDYVLIDSAGNLSSINAFSVLSADKIIMPLQLEKPAFQSTQGTLLAIEETREMIGESVDILSFYNMVRSPETQIQGAFREAYQELFKGMEIKGKILSKDLPLREAIKKRVSNSSNLFDEKLDEKTNDFFKELFQELEIN